MGEVPGSDADRLLIGEVERFLRALRWAIRLGDAVLRVDGANGSIDRGAEASSQFAGACRITLRSLPVTAVRGGAASARRSR